MKKTWKYLLMTALVMGLGMNVTSCKDDNDDNNNERTPEEIAQDPYEKESEAADALYRLVSQLSVCDSLPNNWKTATFEPKAGKVLDASQPRVRTIAVNNAAEAVARYNSLTGKDLPATTMSDTYTVKDVGTLQLNVGGAGTIATIDVDVKQMPQLQQLRLVSVADMGENGHFKGEPYYRFGDVVRDSKGCYWICVRPAYSPNGKEDTHWMSFQLTDKNIKTYTKSGCKEQKYPVDLGVQKEKMQYLAQLLAILANPDGYKNVAGQGNYFGGNGLGGLQEAAMPADSLVRQADLWDQNKVWEKIMPVGFKPDEVQKFKDRFKKNVHFIYEKGSTSGTNLTIKHVGYQGALTFYVEDPAYEKTIIDMKRNSFDITNNYTTIGTTVDPYDFPPDAFVVRYKSGYQLSSNLLFSPSATDSIPGVTTVHRFNACKGTPIIDKKSYTKEQAEPKMILAKNGKFYKSEAGCTADGTTPVALVVYVGDDAEKNDNVAYSGLAMSYTYIDPLKWDDSDQREEVCIENTERQWNIWKNQNNAIERTKKLAEDGHEHPAAKAAWEFKVNDFDPASHGFSPWFLPTAGQALKAIEGLGGDVEFDMLGPACWVSTLPANWKSAGIEDFDIIIDFWTSTEYDKQNAVVYDMHGDDRFIYPTTVSKTAQHPVRPFIAF